jgi:hypothetical protein
MNPDRLLAAIKPQRFSIRMANDCLYHVDHPEKALMAPIGIAPIHEAMVKPALSVTS